jgi:hypothetical protein
VSGLWSRVLEQSPHGSYTLLLGSNFEDLTRWHGKLLRAWESAPGCQIFPQTFWPLSVTTLVRSHSAPPWEPLKYHIVRPHAPLAQEALAAVPRNASLHIPTGRRRTWTASKHWSLSYPGNTDITARTLPISAQGRSQIQIQIHPQR